MEVIYPGRPRPRPRRWRLHCSVIVIVVAIAVAGCTDARSPGSPSPPATSTIPATSTAPASTATADLAPISSTVAPIASSAPSQHPTPPNVSSPPVGAGPGLPTVGVVGVNDIGCRSASRPVVLLHGTFSTVASNFSALVPALLTARRCVFALEYGNGGIAAVTTSAGEVADFVTTVRRVTGARQVDVIAYSQGGLVLRTALRLNGLADQVATAVLIAPSWNGTTSSLAGVLPASLCPACADQVAGSPLLRRLAVGGDLDGAVRYAEISTSGDTVVTPISSQVPTGPADRVRSVLVQDRCPELMTDHVHLPAVPGVIHWVVSALTTDGRPSAVDLTC